MLVIAVHLDPQTSIVKGFSFFLIFVKVFCVEIHNILSIKYILYLEHLFGNCKRIRIGVVL